METPQSGRELRKSQRAPLSMLVQFRSDSLNDFISEYSIDISLGGVFIRTGEKREIGDMIYLQFSLKDGSKLIEGLGRVVHVNTEADGFPGLGIEFVNFDDESMQLIEKIVESNFAKAKRK